MLKILILGAILYFMYRIFTPDLLEDKKPDVRKKGRKIHGNDEDDYIEYEEIE